MLRGAQRASALIRGGARGRCPRVVDPAANKQARAGLLVASPQARFSGSFGATSAGHARWMSATAPGSADDKKDEPKPEPVGLLSKWMGKESCVVGRLYASI